MKRPSTAVIPAGNNDLFCTNMAFSAPHHRQYTQLMERQITTVYDFLDEIWMMRNKFRATGFTVRQIHNDIRSAAWCNIGSIPERVATLPQ